MRSFRTVPASRPAERLSHLPDPILGPRPHPTRGHGIIPFGAIQDSLAIEARRLREALAADEAGVVVAVVCPYCRAQHRHLLAEWWDPEAWHEAARREGTYRIGLR